MFKLKKAQGLSMNVIIVAVLALLILVILSVIFTTKMRDTRKNIDLCESSGGTCVLKDYVNEVDTANYCKGEYDKISSNYYCKQNENQPDKPYTCCIRG